MKKELRRKILKGRNTLPREKIVEASQVIAIRLQSIPDYQTAKTIMFYVSSGNEVDTSGMIRAALANKFRVAVPLVRPETRDILSVLISDPDRDLSPGFKGILEPNFDSNRELSPREPDLIIIPGVAFDPAGNRLGMGKGYYDKFLKSARPDALKIGLAFENQIVSALPVHENDVRMDRIVTEDRVIYCTRIGS